MPDFTNFDDKHWRYIQIRGDRDVEALHHGKPVGSLEFAAVGDRTTLVRCSLNPSIGRRG